VLNLKDLAKELIVQEEKNESLKHDREVIEVKDFVTDRVCGLLEHTILFRKTHIFGHNSNDNDKNYFYYVKFEDDWFLINYLINEICFTLNFKKLDVERVYSNIQYPGQISDWHTDHADDRARTALIMLGPTLPEGVGTFQTEHQNINFERGKLLFFKSRILHRALSGNNPHIPRITLALKCFLPE
jgi:hypothetical protein